MPKSKKTEKELEGKKTQAAKPSAAPDTSSQEKAVPSKSSIANNQGGRDFSKFTLIQGAQKLENLSKGRLALNIVRFYLSRNRGATMSKLKEVFPAIMVKPYGVIQELPTAKRISAKSGRDRYFIEDAITVKGKKIVVTNQWGKKELEALLPIAKKLGMTVK